MFKDETCEIKDPTNTLIGKVRMTSNKMFPIKFEDTRFFSLSMSSKDVSLLWHNRFGHVSLNSLTHMFKYEMVKGLPAVNNLDQICEGCALGKHTRESFSNDKTWRASNPLELIHSDICGPMRTISIGGSRYFLTFIDDYTRKVWIYFLKEKSETYNHFILFKAMVEKQSDHKIKCLRSDRGGEYLLQDLEDFLKLNGIHHQLTASYSPQQNGVAERKTRTLVEMARCMLKNKSLPDVFWAEAIACAAYIINRSLTRSVENKTPQEAWSGFKPSVNHLRIFGCVAYVHIPKQKRGKLDQKSEKVIFVGYGYNTIAYKLYNPYTKKVTISRDVLFDENKT